MKLSKYDAPNYHVIWSRRFHDNKVLLMTYKVGTHNKIVFTKDPTLGTSPYYVSGSNVKKCKKESNGKVMCYAVPMEMLEPLEIEVRDLREVY